MQQGTLFVVIAALLLLAFPLPSSALLFSRKHFYNSQKFCAESNPIDIDKSNRSYQTEKNSIQKEIQDIDLKIELSDSADKRIILNDKRKEAKAILDCMKAIEEIDRDLDLMSNQKEGKDQALKEVASTYVKEFQEMRGQLESLMSKLLSKREISND